MKKENNNGFIHLIVYLIVFAVFVITVTACLEILDLIELPEKYSVTNWIKNNIMHDVENAENDVNTNRKVKIEIENPFEESSSMTVKPVVNPYSGTTNKSEITDSYENFMYYNQLDYYGKIIYSEVEKNLENMKSGDYLIDFGTTFDDLLHEESGEETLNESFQLAINAISFDHPDIFYVDISKLYLLTKITTKLWDTTYTVQIGGNNGQNYLNSSFVNKNEVNYAFEQIEREKNIIKSGLSGSVENKIKGVHDYLVTNLEYDATVSKDNVYNLYGALINKSTVCEGYSRAFKYIMDDMGIPCIIACGTAINSMGELENHAWNYVKIDENWYAIDVTWDDPFIIGNGRINPDLYYKYYLKGSEEFFQNHTENGNIVGDANFKYPSLSLSNYY